ncbi:PKD domain-containing protein [Mucilaginibacter sp. L3T2-6]|uniref:PKD domain-containing protein n=1 Tax=Mucilaginibacter sp. L3T2-6 TaxID=3062491 RepID=UPI0026750D5E|nr:PKD domain-containing protein [Mucilaginibacter sp. L3T2-6]MDO3641556.1 PKD domain-containing protein [Mucilaginibacter sp. L3T2-6]MDV6214050.1 PKD domain-containing protein [Mucilaginibacter sp. L3T2-6]
MPPVNNIKLNDITLEYNSFVDSQVLTAKQLNDIVEFFEDQQRLTRTCLIGVGLVCGLGFKGDANGITVDKGCGVTTDGDLLYLEQTTYQNFRKYDNSKIQYPPFYPLGTSSQQMNLWELVVPDGDGNLPADSLPLSSFAAQAGNTVDQMVGLLYLEYYTKDPDACTAIDCDNQGKKQVAKPKILLLTPTNMTEVINRTNAEVIADDIYKNYYNAYTQYIDFAVLGAKRVFLTSTNIATADKLTNAYINTAKTGTTALVNAIKSLYDTFKFALDKNSNQNITTIVNTFNATFAQSISPYKAQYFYDFYKDLIAAYNELRAILVDIIYQCCPDIYAFPKHIMLGYLNAAATAKPANYRHSFYPSPVIGDDKLQLKNAVSLMERLFLLVQNFSAPNNGGSDIKITPSYDYDRLLEDRAIPFYYSNAATIAAKWSFGRWQRGTDRQVPGYNAFAYANGNDMVLNPLNYSIDSNNFFRIEGHIGKKYADALEEINNQRDNFNLPFDVVAIRLGEADLSDINIDDYACQFDDLEAVLKAFKAEQNCLYAAMSRFFSNFDIKTGAVFKTEEMNQVIGREFKAKAAAPAPKTEKAGTRPAAASAKEGQQNIIMPAEIKMMYSGPKVVDQNLMMGEGALGAAFDYIRKEYNVSSIADYADEAARRIDTGGLTDDEKTIAVDIPIRILAGTRDISQWLPDRLVDIDQDTINNYTSRMDELCAMVKKAQAQSRAIFAKSNYTRKGFEEDYELTLWQLSENCCSGEALQVLLEEIGQRKQKILQQLTFSAYAAKHPGLEHKAGVNRGGTFVLVYAGASAKTPPKDTSTLKSRLDELFAKLRESGRLDIMTDTGILRALAEVISPEEAEDALRYYSEVSGRSYTPAKLEKIAKQLADIATGSKEKRGPSFGHGIGNSGSAISPDTIIADFCLPYLCCSDCPPIAFITPKAKLSLKLPQTMASSDDPALPFTADPADGTVKPAAGFEGTVVKKTDGYYFDPSKVKDGSFGKVINFTLNDQPTDCTITVIKYPEITPKAGLLSHTDQQFTVTLTATTNQKPGDNFIYSWDLGDGRILTNLAQPAPATAPSFVYADVKNTHPDGLLTFRLTATNQGISNTQSCTLQIEFPVEKAVLKLAADEVCSDGGYVPFTTVQPTGGNITSATATVLKQSGQWVIDPSKGPFEKAIKDFKVNGLADATCQITIHEHPAPAMDAPRFKPDAKNRIVVMQIANKTAHAENFAFVWDLGDGKPIKTVNLEQQFNMADYPRGRAINVVLSAINKNDKKCTARITKQILIPGFEQNIKGFDNIIKNAGDMLTNLRKTAGDAIDNLEQNIESSAGSLAQKARGAITELTRDNGTTAKPVAKSASDKAKPKKPVKKSNPPK